MPNRSNTSFLGHDLITGKNPCAAFYRIYPDKGRLYVAGTISWRNCNTTTSSRATRRQTTAAGVARSRLRGKRSRESQMIGVKQRGMDVIFAAHCARVTQTLRHCVKRRTMFRSASRRLVAGPIALHGGHHRAAPGAKSLAVISRPETSEIAVHVIRCNRLALPERIKILE